jgi:hypothetical protein
MARQMIEMGLDDVRALSHDIIHDRLFIVGLGLTLDDTDRAYGAGTDAGAKAVAEEVAYEPRLSIDELNSSLRAVRDTLPAARTFTIVDTNNLPFHNYFVWLRT